MSRVLAPQNRGALPVVCDCLRPELEQACAAAWSPGFTRSSFFFFLFGLSGLRVEPVLSESAFSMSGPTSCVSHHAAIVYRIGAGLISDENPSFILPPVTVHSPFSGSGTTMSDRRLLWAVLLGVSLIGRGIVRAENSLTVGNGFAGSQQIADVPLLISTDQIAHGIIMVFEWDESLGSGEDLVPRAAEGEGRGWRPGYWPGFYQQSGRRGRPGRRPAQQAEESDPRPEASTRARKFGDVFCSYHAAFGWLASLSRSASMSRRVKRHRNGLATA